MILDCGGVGWVQLVQSSDVMGQRGRTMNARLFGDNACQISGIGSGNEKRRRKICCLAIAG